MLYAVLLYTGTDCPYEFERITLVHRAGSDIYHDAVAPGIMTGAYLISSTSVSEFIGAMERMHITEKIVIPMSVIFRFFPTISEEYQAIGMQ